MPKNTKYPKTKCMYFLVALIGYAAPANAVEIGDAAKGLAYAKQVCARCHAILPSESRSPLSTAPTFTAMAKTPGLNRRAFHMFFQSWHPSMPNFIINEQTQDDLISYIESLKDNSE